MVPKIFATIGHSPAALAALLEATQRLAGGELGAREIELVNVATSELNGCGYCVAAHTALGRRAVLSDEELAAARRGQGANRREQAILDLVRRAVRTGGSYAGTELARARAAGLSDGAIMEVLAHVGLKTFTNAAALIAQVEIDFPRPPELPQP